MRKQPKAKKTSKVFTKDDPLWNIVGMIKDDGGPTDVSENKYKYLAEAYADLHEHDYASVPPPEEASAMTKGTVKTVDVTDQPDLLRLAREVQNSHESRLLMNESEELAMLVPLEAPRRRRKSGIVTKKDSLWNIVGLGASEGPGDVSENKHKYLADAYADLHE